MKKILALGLSAIFGLACLGLAACGENEGGDGAGFDPAALVSDKIETDEEWDRAMWNTLTALADFEGGDDPTKTYDGWWYPSDAIYKHASGNYLVSIQWDYHRRTSETEKEEMHMDFLCKVDGKKIYAFNETEYKGTKSQREGYTKAAENGDWRSVFRETDKSGALGEWEQSARMDDELVEELANALSPFLDFSHIDFYWQRSEGYDNPFTREYQQSWYYSQHLQSEVPEAKDYTSILELAEYNEEKGGYTVTNRAVLDDWFGTGVFENLDGIDSCTFKFKDGKLAAALLTADGDRGRGDFGTSGTASIAIAYGGQKVDFPSDLPW